MARQDITISYNPSLIVTLTIFIMQGVRIPRCRIIADVFPDSVQFRLVTNDVFPIIALPDLMHEGMLPHPFRNPDFKPTNNRTDGF